MPAPLLEDVQDPIRVGIDKHAVTVNDGGSLPSCSRCDLHILRDDLARHHGARSTGAGPWLWGDAVWPRVKRRGGLRRRRIEVGSHLAPNGSVGLPMGGERNRQYDGYESDL